MSNKKRGRPVGIQSASTDTTFNKQARALDDAANNVDRGSEELWLRLFFFPETLVTSGMLMPIGANTKFANPQNTFDEHVCDWPQTGPITYKTGHRLAGLSDNVVTDASGPPLELLTVITNRPMMASLREGKNWNQGTPGLDITYTWLSENGVPNFLLGGTLGSAATDWNELNPACAIYDTSIITQLAAMTTTQGSSSTKLWGAFTSVNGGGTATPGTLDPNYFNVLNTIDAHDLILAAGTTGGGQNALYRWIWNDTCAQTASSIYGAPEPFDVQWNEGATNANTWYPTTASPGVLGYNGQFYRYMSSSCHLITTGDVVSAPGFGEWVENDQMVVEVVGHNENEPTVYWTSSIKITAGTALAGPNAPLLLIPNQYRDDIRIRIGVNVAGSAASIQGANNANNFKRTVKVMQTACGGYYGHHMVPAINSLNKLSLWTEMMILSSVVDSGDFVARYAGAGKTVFRQPDLGTYWGDESGSDARGPYTKNASKRFSEVDVLENGERGVLLFDGEAQIQWQQCVKVPSALFNTALISASGDNGTSGKFFATWEIDGMVYAVQVLRSPGVSGQTNNPNTTGGIQPAQDVEQRFTNAWEAKTEEQILALRFPKGNRKTVDSACKMAATMRQSGPSIMSKKQGMQYFLGTVGWRKKFDSE